MGAACDTVSYLNSTAQHEAQLQCIFQHWIQTLLADGGFSQEEKT